MHAPEFLRTVCEEWGSMPRDDAIGKRQGIWGYSSNDYSCLARAMAGGRRVVLGW